MSSFFSSYCYFTSIYFCIFYRFATCKNPYFYKTSQKSLFLRDQYCKMIFTLFSSDKVGGKFFKKNESALFLMPVIYHSNSTMLVKNLKSVFNLHGQILFYHHFYLKNWDKSSQRKTVKHYFFTRRHQTDSSGVTGLAFGSSRKLPDSSGCVGDL